MWDNMFQSVDLLQKGVDASWLRNEVITNNIANADTVGFKTSEVNFEDVFAKQLGDTEDSGQMTTTNDRHISSGSGVDSADDLEARVTRAEDTSYRYDENNVDVEHEMSELAKNTIEYYTLVSKVNSEFSKLNTAITG